MPHPRPAPVAVARVSACLTALVKKAGGSFRVGGMTLGGSKERGYWLAAYLRHDGFAAGTLRLITPSGSALAWKIVEDGTLQWRVGMQWPDAVKTCEAVASGGARYAYARALGTSAQGSMELAHQKFWETLRQWDPFHALSLEAFTQRTRLVMGDTEQIEVLIPARNRANAVAVAKNMTDSLQRALPAWFAHVHVVGPNYVAELSRVNTRYGKSLSAAPVQEIRELIPLVQKDGRQDGFINSDGDYDDWYDKVRYDDEYGHIEKWPPIDEFVRQRHKEHLAWMLDSWARRDSEGAKNHGLIEHLLELGADDQQGRVVIEAYEASYAQGLRNRLQEALDEEQARKRG